MNFVNIKSLFIKERVAIGLTIFVGLTFLLTWHGHFAGYEKETWQSAENWLNGQYEVRRGGLVAVLLYVPFVVLARLLPMLNSERFFSLVPVAYSTIQTVVLFYVAKKCVASEKTAAVWAIIVTMVSGMWVYAYAGMEYQAGLFLAALLLALLKWSERPQAAWWPSIAMAALLATKSYMVLIGLPYIVCLYLGWKKIQQSRQFWSFRFLLSAGLVPTLVLLLTISLNWYVFGRLSGSYNFGNEFQITQWWEGFYGLFFSPGKNVFLYAPLLITTLWLWPRWSRLYPQATVFIFGSLIMLALVNLPFTYWTDETWGPRKFVPILPLLHLPLLLVFSEWSHQKIMIKTAIVIITLASLWINFLGAAYDYGRLLTVTHAANLDSLSTMRYLPEWSHPFVFNELLYSYAQRHSGKSVIKEYRESTWFRWVRPGGYDIILRKVHLNLSQFDQPSIIWLQPGWRYRVTGKALLGAWTISGAALYFLIKNPYGPKEKS